MIDTLMTCWEFVWAFIAPVVLVLFMAGAAIYAIFILPRETDSLWLKSESVGFGLVVASLCYGFVVWLFEFRGMESSSEDTFPMMDTILAMGITLLAFWATELLRLAGLPRIVIGITCVLGILFGF